MKLGEFMRVIAGKARRMTLITPQGLSTRPTTDRIKESLFNIINFDLQDCKFLDLFSGSGAIGIEALSRGAKKAVFIEQNPDAIHCIKENLAKTNLSENASVLHGDVISWLQTLGDKEEKFGIIFMDPPYEAGIVQQSLQVIKDSNLLEPHGYVIVERGSGDFKVDIPGYCITKEKVYKTTTMTFILQEENQ